MFPKLKNNHMLKIVLTLFILCCSYLWAQDSNAEKALITSFSELNKDKSGTYGQTFVLEGSESGPIVNLPYRIVLSETGQILAQGNTDKQGKTLRVNTGVNSKELKLFMGLEPQREKSVAEKTKEQQTVNLEKEKLERTEEIERLSSLKDFSISKGVIYKSIIAFNGDEIRVNCENGKIAWQSQCALQSNKDGKKFARKLKNLKPYLGGVDEFQRSLANFENSENKLLLTDKNRATLAMYVKNIGTCVSNNEFALCSNQHHPVKNVVLFVSTGFGIIPFLLEREN